MKNITKEQYFDWIRKQVFQQNSISAERLVTKSYYIGEIDKPADVNLRHFDWLLSITKKEVEKCKREMSFKN